MSAVDPLSMSLDAVIALNKKSKTLPAKRALKERPKPVEGSREGGKAKFQKTREAPYVPKAKRDPRRADGDWSHANFDNRHLVRQPFQPRVAHAPSEIPALPLPAAVDNTPKPPLMIGFRLLVTNLPAIVNKDDVMVLFSEVGKVRKAAMVCSGTAEVTMSTKEEALRAIAVYDNRELDETRMKVFMVATTTASGTEAVPVTSDVANTPAAPVVGRATIEKSFSAPETKFTVTLGGVPDTRKVNFGDRRSNNALRRQTSRSSNEATRKVTPRDTAESLDAGLEAFKARKVEGEKPKGAKKEKPAKKTPEDLDSMLASYRAAAPKDE